MSFRNATVNRRGGLYPSLGSISTSLGYHSTQTGRSFELTQSVSSGISVVSKTIS